MTSQNASSTPSAPAGGVEPHREGATGGWRAAMASWASTLVTVLVTVLVLLGVRHFLVDWFKVPSASMENTLLIGDLIVVDKRERGQMPARGTVVVFDGTSTFGTDPGPIYVKRVVGVEGDHVTCCSTGGKLVLNGKEVDEPYVFPGDRASDFEFDVTVPAGKVWMMGDHRSVSGDSREHLGDPGGGMVPATDIIGPVTAVVWPWSRHSMIDNPAG